MKIQINTDKTINGDKRHNDFFSSQLAQKLKRFDSHLTRIEAHISDENGLKEGANDTRCLLEARMEGRQPIAVSHQADTYEQAVSGAIDKLKSSLDTIIGRIENH